MVVWMDAPKELSLSQKDECAIVVQQQKVWLQALKPRAKYNHMNMVVGIIDCIV